MSILIGVASRHGSTVGIAQALAQELRQAGQTVDVRTLADNPSIENYEAIIIGSAVYLGGWLPQARQFIEQHQQQLLERPVWLFSSGPTVAGEPRAADEPSHIDELIREAGARGHRTFAGKLDRSQLDLGERFIIWNVNRMKAGGVPDGDFRDWDAIRTWADEIATALDAAQKASSERSRL